MLWHDDAAPTRSRADVAAQLLATWATALGVLAAAAFGWLALSVLVAACGGVR